MRLPIFFEVDTRNLDARPSVAFFQFFVRWSRSRTNVRGMQKKVGMAAFAFNSNQTVQHVHIP